MMRSLDFAGHPEQSRFSGGAKDLPRATDEIGVKGESLRRALRWKNNAASAAEGSRI